MGLRPLSTGAAMQRSGLADFSDGCGFSHERGPLRGEEAFLLLIPVDMKDAMQLVGAGEGGKDKQSQ